MHTLAGWWIRQRKKPVATREESGDVDLSESETWSFDEEEVTGTWSIQQIRKLGKSQCWKKIMVTQSTCVSSRSSPYGSSLLDRQEDLRTRTWRPYGWFGREYGYLAQISECHSSRSSSSSWTRLWGEITIREESSLEWFGTVIHWKWKKLISDQTEIIGMTTIDFKEFTWRSTSLLCSRAYRITNAKTHIFSDSVLCVERHGRRSYCNLEEQN